MMEEIARKLSKSFPEEARSVDDGRGFELTGIKNPYVIERLNEVFGLCGTGWSFEIGPIEDVDGFLKQFEKEIRRLKQE